MSNKNYEIQKNRERNKSVVLTFIIIVLVTALFTGCDKNEDNGDKNPTTTETPTITSKNEVTNIPVPTETVEPTETPNPTATDKPDPTEAPKPTSTPKPTATPTTSAGKEILLDVVAEGQDVNFESGSGIMAASMVLKYYGINVEPNNLYNSMDIVNENRTDVTPWEYCMGDPKTGFSLYYAPVVKNMINTYLSNNGITSIKAKDITGCEPTEIYNNVLNGNPVIIVANEYLESTAENGVSWTLPNGETFTWKLGTSYFVIIGVSGNDVTVIAAEFGGTYTMSKSDVEASFTAYESQAIIIE